MLTIKANSTVETLRTLAVDWGGEFQEGFGSSVLTLNNDVGTGTVTSHDIFPGFGAFTYNITFNEEIQFQKDESAVNSLYFLYNLKGYWYHKFSGEDELKKIAQMQNVVVSSSKKNMNVILLPKNVKLELTVVLIMPDKINIGKSENSKILQKTIQSLKFISNKSPYKYFGEINLNTAKYAKIAIKNERTNVSGRLLTQSAIIQILATQYEAYEAEKNNDEFKSPLKENDLEKIVKLGDYISENMSSKLTVKELSKVSGLSPLKLQEGMRFLHGKSLNSFIRDVKLEHAKDLIQNTDLSISEVVYKIGFNNRSYFSKIFRQRFGLLPFEFKEKKNNLSLYELSYRSTEKPGITSSDIENIIETSRKNNKKNDITGCLINFEGMFFQIIEGPKSAVLNLYKILKQDSRHFEVTELWKGVKLNRQFKDWNLAAISESGKFQTSMDGDAKHLDIEKLKGNMDKPSVTLDILWNRVRNILKTA